MTIDRIIAVEEHIVTERFLSVAHELDFLPAERTEVEIMRGVEKSPSLGTRLIDLDTRIEEMDACGQSVAVLSLNPPGVQPYKASDAVPLAREFNDSLAEIVSRHPDRFAGLGTVSPQDPAASAHEIERIMGPLRLNGIMINSHTGGHYLDEPEFAPLLDAAERCRAPIYLHPREPSMLAAYNKYGMEGAVWGFQAEAGLHAMRLILSGALDRNPELKIVLGHLGEAIPYWLRRIDNRHAFAQRIAGAATAMPRLELTPSEYFRRNFVLTTSGVDDPQVLEFALQAVGDDRIMFAIDSPYEDTTSAIAFCGTPGSRALSARTSATAPPSACSGSVEKEQLMALEGKTAVVTGGGRGIGRAYCERLAAEGANVVVVDKDDATPLLAALSGSGEKVALTCDVGEAAQIEAVAAAVLHRFGRCDIFVNNAAYTPMITLETMTSDVWRLVQAINVEPIVHFTKAFVPAMAAAGWGRIVTTGSSITLNPQSCDLAYITSKSGVHGVTKALANELGGKGITVNSIAPTVVKTEGFEERLSSDGPSPDELMERIVSQQTIKRSCLVKDVADALAFLVSDDAGFITGQIIHVDGGRTRSGA